MIGSISINEIDKKRFKLDDLSKKIWENPEKAFKEFKACENTANFLRSEGFDVEVGVGGLATAIRASFGSGKPVIGFMGEFDALPGLNQKVSTKQEAFELGAYGHGCGHNLLCTAHVGAVVGLKREMIENNLSGTIVFYACPGEEQLTGKGFMARGGAFEGLDLAINFHPNKISEATIGTSTAVNSVKFHFKGKTAHAGSDPQNGRSALDAVELTNVGANYLREHVTSDVRIHYTITDGGVAECMNEIKQEPWTREELDFAAELDRQSPQQYKAMISKYNLPEGTHLYYGGGNVTNFNSYGSTDIGDVMHIVPTAYFFTGCTNLGAPGHSWQFTSCAGSSIGEKGMIYASKIMAMFGAKILNNPEIAKKAKEEFDKSMNGKTYKCPIPDDIPTP